MMGPNGYRRKRSELRLNAIIDLVGEGKRILDAGCNTGFISLGLARAGAREVMGLDIDGNCIVRARELASRERLCNAHFLVQDLSKLKWIPSENFDAVVCLSTLHHIIADSRDYGMQAAPGIQSAMIILSEFARIAPVLVLEVGTHNEARPWAKKMPRLDIPDLLLRVGYKNVRRLSPPGFRGWDGLFQRFLHAFAYRWLSKPQNERLRKLLRFDNRDGRALWLATTQVQKSPTREDLSRTRFNRIMGLRPTPQGA